MPCSVSRVGVWVDTWPEFKRDSEPVCRFYSVEEISPTSILGSPLFKKIRYNYKLILLHAYMQL